MKKIIFSTTILASFLLSNDQWKNELDIHGGILNNSLSAVTSKYFCEHENKENLAKEILEFFKSIYFFHWKHFTFKKAGLIDSESFKSYFAEIFGDITIGELKIPAYITATDLVKGKDFKVFDEAEYIGGIAAEGCGEYTRKQLDALTDFVKRPQIGAKGLVYVRFDENGTPKSSVDKFYSADDLKKWGERFGAKPGDLILILSGDDAMKTRKQLCELRLEVAGQLGLRDKNKFACLWVIDFPLFEWDDETQRYYAVHHPFTSPKDMTADELKAAPEEAVANAYDMVINGYEVGGGSVRAKLARWNSASTNFTNCGRVAHQPGATRRKFR